MGPYITSSVGVWNGGCMSHSSPRLHGNRRSKRCSYTAANKKGPHITRTTVWSDMWAAYNGVSALPGVASHETVNHSIQFMNHMNGVHTNAIEGYRNRYHEVTSKTAL